MTDEKRVPGQEKKYMEQFALWRSMTVGDADAQRELDAIAGNEERIREHFGDELRFGTGGLRGIMGVGTARMNTYVVRRASMGLAAYVKKAGLPPAVAVGYDSRMHSEDLAMAAAKTFTACGLDAWIYPRLEPTPALSWAVRQMGCGAGVMITASHNPAEYNGYKVYGPDGCQITDEMAAKILSEIRKRDYFDGPRFDGGVSGALEAEGRLREIPQSVLDGFLRREHLCLIDPKQTLEGLRVVYTPLNGTGLECVKRALQEAGVSDVAVVPEQERPDGKFPTCPAPNPEKKEAMELGLALCGKLRSDILLATDPDCDRAGVALPDKNGNYRLLSGNEIGILLLNYICERKNELGTMPDRPVAVTTIVSTDTASAIAAHYGVELRRTLTGFKYIGEQIGLLEKAGEEDRFLFGFEESFGYLSATHVRDKDAVNACLMICEMAAFYKRAGRNVLEVLAELKRRFGDYEERLVSCDFEGIDGTARMRDTMTILRTEPPEELAGRPVLEIIDYLHSERTALPLSDVLEFRLTDGSRITVRPSGTEPKMKVYFSMRRDKTLEPDEDGAAPLDGVIRQLRIQP